MCFPSAILASSWTLTTVVFNSISYPSFRFPKLCFTAETVSASLGSLLTATTSILAQTSTPTYETYEETHKEKRDKRRFQIFKKFGRLAIFSFFGFGLRFPPKIAKDGIHLRSPSSHKQKETRISDTCHSSFNLLGVVYYLQSRDEFDDWRN